MASFDRLFAYGVSKVLPCIISVIKRDVGNHNFSYLLVCNNPPEKIVAKKCENFRAVFFTTEPDANSAFHPFWVDK